jgi:NAD(P)-dependent dehydrogenase (short-subunit alcohol dehydrogenase family)
MFTLTGKAALVTGAGSGIGRSIAETFARQGATVWVVDLNEPAGAATVAAIRATGGLAEFAALDVSDAAAALALAARLPALDVLVNNAGIGHVGDLLRTGAADLDRLHAVNVRGPFNLCKAFVPAMLERRCGSVINLASVGGVVAVRDRLAYTVTKHAVVGLTKALALDHSHTGVRFNSICPGRTETPWLHRRLAEYPDDAARADYVRAANATQLNGRMVRTEDIHPARSRLGGAGRGGASARNFRRAGGAGRPYRWCAHSPQPRPRRPHRAPAPAGSLRFSFSGGGSEYELRPVTRCRSAWRVGLELAVRSKRRTAKG